MKEIFQVVAEVLVPQIQKQRVEVCKTTPQVRASERVVELLAAPQIQEHVVEMC